MASSKIPLLLSPFLAMLCLTVPSTRAATIGIGDVTTTLGPTFFVDDAVTGGSDVTITQPAVAVYNRSFAGLLDSNQGPARVTLTGFGFATSTSASNNTATSLTVTFTYLGADEAVGGGDDVVMGSATGTYAFTTNGEYAFAFDTPITANLTITGTRFLIQVAPSNGSGNGKVLFKAAALTYETASGPKFSVAGIVPPQRLNLAKYQTATTDSVNGQRLASYLTDGVAGNDNRWQSLGSAPHWAQVDFPFPVEIGSAQVFSGVNDTSALTSFKLQYLDGNSAWVDVPGASVTGNTNVERNVVFTTPVTASSFRIYDSVDANAAIRELALYPPNGAGGFPLGTDLILNLAMRRPAVANANTTGNFALLAVDGRVNHASMWQTSTAGTNWLEIDLIESSKIGSAHFYSGSPGVAPLADFVLKYWNGSAWQDIPGANVTGNTTADLVVSFTTPVTTSKVRLEFTNPGTASVRELCIYPTNTGNSGYPLGTGVTGVPPSTAKFDDYTDAFYQINNPSAGIFIAVGGSGEPALSQSGLTTAQGQYQIVLNISTGTYRLRNRATGNCLSGAQLSTTPGEPLTDEPYAAMPHQDWILDPLDGGAFQLINQWSGLAIDLQGGSTAAGTPLVQNTADGSASQRWQALYSAGSPKKGIGGGSFVNSFKADWMYGWGLATTATLPADAVFHPMQWGNFNWTYNTSAPSTWKLYPTWRSSSEPLQLMGFNEPDTFSQSGDSLDTANTNEADFSPTRSMEKAVELWPRLQAMDLPLVAPCPANMTSGWLADFYTQANARGYRVDYTAKHSYGSPGGGSADGLINGVLEGYTLWGKPMWLTEFSFVDWNGNSSWSEEDTYNCLAEFIWRAESLPWLRKYALFVFTEDAGNPQPANPWQDFTPAPRSNSLDINGNMTAFGKLYAAWDNDAAVRTAKPYYIHNKNTRKRLANLLASGPNARSIRVDDNSVTWTLASAGVSNRYYLVSSRDGRRMSYAGSSITLAAANTTGAAVEWSLTENQYGWYYLNHPSTSTRLQLAYNNSTGAATYTMVANTNTGDAGKWRFIVPPPPPAWSGANDISWITADNWTDGNVPSAGDAVSFDSSSTANLNTVLNQDFDLVGVTVTTPAGPVSIGGTHSLSIGASGIDLAGASQDLTISAPLVMSAAQTWSAASGRTLSVNGTLSGAFPISLAGAGTVSLNTILNPGVAMTIGSGTTLKTGIAGVFSNDPSAVNPVLNGYLDLNGTQQSINALDGSGIIDNLAAGTAALTVGNNDASVTLNTLLQNTNGMLALVKTGASQLNLMTTNTFSGGFTNNGTGNVYPKNIAAFGTGPVVMNGSTIYCTPASYTFENTLTLNGATLRVGGGGGHTVTWNGPVTATGASGLAADGGTAGITLANTLNIDGATFTSFANGTANTISGAISGGSGTVMVTSGTLNLNSPNTFSGVFRSSLGGPLKIGDANAMQSATLDMNAADSGTVNLSNLNATIGALTGTRNLTLGSGTVSIGNNNSNTNYSGILSGGGSLVKTGNGILTLSGPNTYGGTTTVSGGTLAIGANDVLPATPVVIGNAILDAATFTDTAGTLTVTGAATINLGSGAALAFANSSAAAWSGGALALTGTFVPGSSLRFGTNAAGLAPAQLALISATGLGPFTLDANGYLTTVIPGGYGSWASTNAPTGTATDDFDDDGVSNGMEYVLGGDKDTNDLGKLPQISATGGNLVFSFKRDQDSIDGSTSVVIEIGSTLADWPASHPVPDTAVANNPGLTVIKDSPVGFDTVTLVVPQALDTRKFGRLKVVTTP